MPTNGEEEEDSDRNSGQRRQTVPEERGKGKRPIPPHVRVHSCAREQKHLVRQRKERKRREEKKERAGRKKEGGGGWERKAASLPQNQKKGHKRTFGFRPDEG